MKWPRFTPEGFKKMKLPKDLYDEIFGYYNANKVREYVRLDEDKRFDDDYGAHIVAGSIEVRFAKPQDTYVKIQDLPLETIHRWAEMIRPHLEEWCGEKLVFSTGYGIREYIPNSVLSVHRDNKRTHVVSANIFIDESPDGFGWPLEFVDHEKNIHKVIFEHGDILFYESLCPHSRIIPFQGNFYRNMFFHYRPADWDHTLYDGKKVKYYCMQEVLDEVIEQ